jgi:hypothetical protein
MKTLAIAALILLVGCAGRPTLEQLETEASISGDWTAVESRERMNARMRTDMEPKCPEGRYLLCEKKGEREICACELNRNAAWQ